MIDWSALRARPYEIYAHMQQAPPASLAPGMHVLTRYEDVIAALRDARLSHWSDGAGGSFDTVIQRWVALMDPRRAPALRRRVVEALTPKALESKEQALEVFAENAIERRARPESLDVVAELARPLAQRVVAELFGVPERAWPRFFELLETVRTSLVELLGSDPVIDPRIAALDEALSEWVADPAAAGIPQAIRLAQADGDRISSRDLGAFAAIFLYAAYDNMLGFLGLAVHSLAGSPERWAELGDAPEIDDAAIDELVRYDGPVQFVQLVAEAPLELAGLALNRGDRVLVGLAAANQDPAVFAEPRQIDLQRAPNPHLGFGIGAMRCIGAHLARLEARVVLRVLLRRVAVPKILEAPIQCQGPVVLRGFERLVISI